jgi:uncharacterized GH25 family protein
MNPLAKLALACLPLLAAEARAHALWVEPSEGGYRIFFGEPGEGMREKKEEFSKVGPVKALDAAGKVGDKPIKGAYHAATFSFLKK